MQQRNYDRYAPLAGVVFLILAAIAILILEGNTPDADAKLPKVIQYWSDHDGKAIADSIIGVFGAIFLVWFGGALRAALWRAEGGSGRLSTVAFSGAVIGATALLIGSALEFATADTVNDISPQATQALSALYEDYFFPYPAAFFLLTMATGLVILRSRFLPRWLGWLSVALAIICVTPIGFIGFFGSLLWVGLVGFLLFRLGDTVGPAGTPGPGPTAATAPAAPPPATGGTV
jgi:hypothetical protein